MSTTNVVRLPQGFIVPDADTRKAEGVAAEAITRAKSGWSSPVYTQSRQVTLDRNLVKDNRCVAFEEDSTTLDSYKILRAQIMKRMESNGWNTIMVTSALPDEGKTTTAINLALTMAKDFNRTVLLVDCDLQQQDVHKYLGYRSDKGIVDYLLDDCPVKDLLVWPGIEKVTLISGGRTVRESSDLLGSPRMKELVADLKSRYPDRVIIFDMKSSVAGADSLEFTPLVDGVLMVVQEGRSSVHDINTAIEQLPEGKLLGLMLNRHKAASHSTSQSASR
jgi:non-specific protein-tyrosine kinase